MEEIEWIYQRDKCDLTLSKAAKLLECADFLEVCLLQKAYCGEWVGHFPPQRVLSISPERIAAALDVLHLNAYREGEPIDKDYLRLLARIGTPVLSESIEPSGEHEVEFWPQADWQSTRRDLLHFYLLVKAEYIDLKARLQTQSVEGEALHQIADWAGRLLETDITEPASMADFKKEIIRSWHFVTWSPPEEGPPEPIRMHGQCNQWREWFSRLFS